MSRDPDCNPAMVLRKYLPDYARPGMLAIEMGPGRRVGKSLVKTMLDEIGADYHFADIGNWGRKHPGFVRMADDWTIECESDRFDLAVGYCMFRCVRVPWRWLPEVCRIVKPGGHVMIVDTVGDGLGRRAWPIEWGRVCPDGIRMFFAEAGLTTVVAEAESLDKRDRARIRQYGRQLGVATVGIGRKENGLGGGP